MAAFVQLFIASLLLQGAHAVSFTITNNCDFYIWPATLSGSGAAALPSTGFLLAPGSSTSLTAPHNWSGRIWGRTGCSINSNGTFSCLSGDCGTGAIFCSGKGGSPPATLAEFTLNGADGKDFYDTSLVDGFNLPVEIEPDIAGCSATDCSADVNRLCPPELMQKAGSGEVIGCKSPCLALKEDEYCCTGEYGNPNTCKATSYSMIFKGACPRAYSYPFDDATSTFTCVGANYLVRFCPARVSGFAKKKGRRGRRRVGLKA